MYSGYGGGGMYGGAGSMMGGYGSSMYGGGLGGYGGSMYGSGMGGGQMPGAGMTPNGSTMTPEEQQKAQEE
jgi:peroxin-13